MNRRSFFQSVGALVGAAALFPIVAQGEGRRGSRAAKAAGAGPQLVDPNDRQAKGVNYVEINTAITDKSLMAERGGVKFANQKCNNCAFYVNDKEVSVGGKKAGPCQMPFANGKVVTAEGWCSSWAKKA